MGDLETVTERTGRLIREIIRLAIIEGRLCYVTRELVKALAWRPGGNAAQNCPEEQREP
jgi:hypothetical protein